MTRRAWLAAMGAAPVFAQQQIGPPAHAKGPRVFLDYDQVELDAAYDQSVYAPNMQQVVRRQASNSDLARLSLGEAVRKAYGPTEIEKLDIYRTKHPNAPIHVFIHGGAWRSGVAKDVGFLAEIFVGAGAHFMAPDFVAVQDAGGSLTPMAEQVRRSIEWVHQNAASFGGDRDRIYLAGDSSGAHLACAALTMLPGNEVKGALLVSGMYDLKGPRLSSRSSYVKFDDATEDALSPQRHIDKISTPLIVAYGSLETPEFQRQAREFAAAVKAAGKPVELIRGEGYNHLEIIETLASPYGQLGRAALRQMKLASA
jgi:arylformamidase